MRFYGFDKHDERAKPSSGMGQWHGGKKLAPPPFAPPQAVAETRTGGYI
jgi:hypothetical protein